MRHTFFEHHLERTRPEDMIKITSYLREDLLACGIKNGIAIIHSPHTTAGITINENADPDVVHDMLYGLAKSILSKTAITGIWRGTPTPI